MPTSDPTGLHPVIARVMKMRPKSILDVGVGMGKWGLLFREYLEGWGFHRYKPSQWELRIDGVEAWEDYIQDWHRVIYNHIYQGDIRQIAHQLGHYDLVYLGDVIEHMTKPEGHRLLQTLNYTRAIISTPNFATNKAHRAKKPNPFQEHKCQWSLADFKPYKRSILRGAKNERLLVVEVWK